MDAQAVMALLLPKLILLSVLAMLLYHLVAGVKHLLMDFHIGVSFAAASGSAIMMKVYDGATATRKKPTAIRTKLAARIWPLR